MDEEKKVMIKEQLYLNNNSKGILDAAQEKLASRKLLVFLTATALMLWAGLDETNQKRNQTNHKRRTRCRHGNV